MSLSTNAQSRAKVLRGDAALGARHASNSGALNTFETTSGSSRQITAAEAAEAASVAGFDQGYADGLEAARAAVEGATDDANRRVRRALAALCTAVDSFDERQTIALADVEDAIVAAAFELTRELLGNELKAATNPGADAIARALRFAPDRGDVIAHLHPTDAETLSMDTVSTSTRSVTVVANPNVEPGDCIVEVGETRIDAQFGTALARVREALSLPLSIPLTIPLSDVAAGSSSTPSRTTAAEAPVA